MMMRIVESENIGARRLRNLIFDAPIICSIENFFIAFIPTRKPIKYLETNNDVNNDAEIPMMSVIAKP